MNKRIEDLREQAAIFAEMAYDKQTIATFHTNKSIEDLFETKFAELIVQECAKVCADNGMRAGGRNTSVGETFLDASKLIRGNFGLDTFGLY